MTGEARALRAFTLAELLVVIAIVALLVAMLLSALAQARNAGLRSRTLSTMSAFAAACEAFSIEHGRLPSVVSEGTIAFHNHQIVHGVDGVAVSSTEDALLGLLGGCVVQGTVDPATYDAYGGSEYTLIEPTNTLVKLRVNNDRMGEGPIIDGRPYAPYLTPGAADVRVLDGTVPQWGAAAAAGGGDDAVRGIAEAETGLPDLADAWGRPVLLMRRARQTGPLVGDAHEYALRKPQFYVDSLWPYTRAAGQIGEPPGAAGGASLLYSNYFTGAPGGFDPSLVRRAMAKLARHPVSTEDDPLDPLVPGTARGSFMLISAGPDGVYFSATDGPGTRSDPIGSPGCTFESFLTEEQRIFDSFDDLVVTGGSR